MTTDFVCVRMVKMNGVDLGQFQFDYDLTWSAFFLHADGTVYARYGSRTVEGPMVSNSREGLLLTMQRVLEVHKKYPANRHLFEGKRGSEPEFRRPEEIPSPRVRSGGGQINRGNCIHCHNVHEALHDVELKGGSRLPRRIFKYPLPENIGLVIKKGSGNRVLRVLQDSPSAMAGIEAGDEVYTLNGQAILSIADIQFVLHSLPEETDLDIQIRRRGRLLEKGIVLAGEWRKNDFTWRTSMNGLPPGPGLYLYKLGEEEKGRLGIDRNRIALEVRGLFEEAVQRSELRLGDIIIGYDGLSGAIGAPRFEDYVRVNHFKPGSVLELEVLREGEPRAVKVSF